MDKLINQGANSLGIFVKTFDLPRRKAKIKSIILALAKSRVIPWDFDTDELIIDQEQFNGITPDLATSSFNHVPTYDSTNQIYSRANSSHTNLLHKQESSFPSSRDINSFFKGYISELVDMKYNSAVNKALNSYAPLVRKISDKKRRKIFIKHILETLVQQQKIKLVGANELIMLNK